MNFILDVLGTPAYFAPETLNCVISDAPSGYGKAVDLQVNFWNGQFEHGRNILSEDIQLKKQDYFFTQKLNQIIT